MQRTTRTRINTEANLEPSALLDDTTTDVLDPTDINNPTGYLSTSADKNANSAHRTPKRIRVTAENVTGIEGPSSIGKSDCSLPDEVHQKNASLLNRISNKEKRVTSEQYHQQRQTIVSLEERFAKVKRTNTTFIPDTFYSFLTQSYILSYLSRLPLRNYTLSSPIVLFTTSKSFVTNKHHQAKHIATVICSMVAFALNRRANRSQLLNAIRFLACGISETVNEYAHYMGLCSSRKTAIQALRSLSADSQDRVEDAMDASQLIAPLLCIDNLDMEERVHKSTVGKQTRMFHGTWGYIHIPSKTLMDTLDPSELTLASYHASLQKAALMVIEPDFFLPSDPSGEEYALVLKSQIARVMLKYVATPADKKTMLPLDPPTVKQISTKAPNIHMLKLMDESDNSAEGIGQVMEALQRQSGLEPIDFFGRLQLVDGNLGTCQIFNALRSLRLPSEYCNHNLNNVHFTLGAAHTLWNIAQTILTHHFGNPNKSDDLGVWQYLDAIGIAPEKVIQKKDFTKMIQAMELVHEDKLLTEQLPTMPTPTWNDTVERCYKLYCSPEARDNVFDSDPVLLNLLIRLQDFSTVIEASRAMKAGDVGRLIRVWNMWSIMTQLLPGLTHYSAYLPRLVLLITRVLPPSLGKLIRHNLLVSPSGRANHFVAKDFLLETSNYWLKYFYNRAGIGTQIDWLKDLFSSNIPLLCSMFKSLRINSGGKHFQQSHKASLNMRALERFNQMANDKNILGHKGDNDSQPKTNGAKVHSVPDTYLEGIRCLMAQTR
ncbi:hypothetical protein PSTT_16342 [Puccinia striiformis]|uniref:DUF6589 domain-containing protein n=1 Tax=Puccinia striiformis TaxID=27350 RepID=A0A2S4UDB1_9BASI|nr:hypothetical protein PSTT_16342 [Puccinia striiformis]